jgi:hypothetical protein
VYKNKKKMNMCVRGVLCFGCSNFLLLVLWRADSADLVGSHFVNIGNILSARQTLRDAAKRAVAAQFNDGTSV